MLINFSILVLVSTFVISVIHFLLLCFHNGTLEVVWFIRFLIAFLIAVIVAAWGFKKKSIDHTGIIGGLFVGTILGLSSYCFLACLLAFFYSSSKVTKLNSERKRQIEEDFKEGGQRNWIQVLCNGGVATELALLYALHGGLGECTLNFEDHYVRSWLSAAVISSLAAANGDTWASEIGSVLSSKEPWLITTFQRVPIGTNGGVSLIGIVVSALGGAVVGCAYFLALFATQGSSGELDISNQATVSIFVGVVAGLFGSLIDSVIGATLQYSGIDKKTRKVVQSPGPCVKHICGRHILNNHSVNMVMSIISSIVVPTVTAKLFTTLLV